MGTVLSRRMQGLKFFSLLVLTCSLMGCNGSGGDAGSSGSNGSGASTAPFMPTPDADEFYAQPGPMPKLPAGTILNSRKVQLAPLSIPLPNDAWQLQYMSTDMHGNPQSAIATVVKPLLPSVTAVPSQYLFLLSRFAGTPTPVLLPGT